MISGQNNILTSIQEQTVDLVKRGLPNVQVLNYAPDGYWYHLGLNTRKKPLNDPRFRKALALVIDKQGFAKNIFGKDQARVPGPLPWIYGEAISQDDLAKTPGMRTPTDQDYADAKSLLSAAAVDKVTLTITAAVEQLGTHQYKALAEYVKSQVEKYLPGVTINIDATNYTAMLAKIGQPDTNFDIYTGGWVHELSPIAMMSVSYYSKGGRNFGGYNDSKLDGYLDSANAELDAAKRADLIRNAQKLALEQWSHIPTHHGQFTALLSPNVRNLELGSVAGASYYLKYAWLKG